MGKEIKQNKCETCSEDACFGYRGNLWYCHNHRPDKSTGYTREKVGYKNLTTSYEAAKQVMKKALAIRNTATEYCYRNPEGINPDKFAEMIGEHVLDVRPRFSESDYLVHSGRRAKSERGNPQDIYVHVKYNG